MFFRYLLILACLGMFWMSNRPFLTRAQLESELAGSLLITEVMYHAPGADSEQEWVEIGNVGQSVIDLSDVKVGDAETPGKREGMKRFPEGAVIEPGQAIVVAQTAVGFRQLYGFNPDYEIKESDPDVPVMRDFPLWERGDFALNNQGDEVLLVDGFTIIDAINYGSSIYFFSPSIAPVLAGQSIERVPADCDTDSAADWQTRRTPTPGELFFEGECREPHQPAEVETLLPIGQIQGRTDVSPYVNQIVSFRGVVTGVFESRNQRGVTFYTLFVQDLPGQEDGDPETSDGIAVFLGVRRPLAGIGDQVRVTGRVIEFFGLTEIDSEHVEVQIERRGIPLPEPAPIDPPADEAAQAAYFERLEGMRVTIEGAARVVGATYESCGFAVVGPNVTAERFFKRQEIDPTGQVVPILHHSNVHCVGFPDVKTGDRVEGLVGPLIYHFDQFKIVQQFPEELVVTAVPFPPLPSPPLVAQGQFAVASFNVENLFDDIDDTGDEAEPKLSPAVIALRYQKLAYALVDILGCPAVVGIQEVEKASLLHGLAAEAAPGCGFLYQVTHQDSPDVRGIDVALMSDPRRVQVLSARLRQTCTPLNTGIRDPAITCPAGHQPLFSRPPIQVETLVEGEAYTFFVNHFKSKRGGAAETAAERLAQAQHINALVDELLAEDEQAQIVVMGDFNDYELSPAMLTMTENGRLTNALLQLPDETRYTFVFGGVSQLIDGILLSPALVDRVAQAAIQHVNADFPAAMHLDVSAHHLPYRATDHDLPVVVLALGHSQGMQPAATTAVLDLAPEEALQLAPGRIGRWFWPLVALLGLGAAAALLYRRRQ